MRHSAPHQNRGAHARGLTPLRASRAVVPAAIGALLLASGAVLVGHEAAGASEVEVTGRAIVGFEPGTRSARASEVLASLGISPGKDLGSALHARAVDLAPGQSQKLAHAPGVTYVEPDATAAVTWTPNDPYFPWGSGSYYGGQWGFDRAKVVDAWSVSGPGSPNIRIAVIDTGVASAHPDLSGGVMPGRNFLDGSSNTTDTYGHGTSVAGAAAARTDNGVGIAGTCGGCSILPIKVSTDGSATYSNLASAITWAADQGARVINVSMGGSSSSSTLTNAVSYARGKGSVVVAAAGNSGCSCLTYPAATSGVIAVGATSNSTGNPLTSTSNFGSWVDIAAPTGQLTTTLASSGGGLYGYMPVGGTSLSTPVVAGIAGLLLSEFPGASAAQVEQALVSGTSSIAGTNQVATGLVNAANAESELAGVLAGTPSPSPTPTAAQSSPAPTASATPTASPTPTDPPTTSPSPTDTSTPTPADTTTASPSPTDTASSSPSPTPATTTSTTTVTLSASLTRKATTKSYSVTTRNGGQMDSSLSFNCSSLTLTVTDPAGKTLLQQTGPSALLGTIALPAGTSTLRIGTSSKCSFTLTYTAPA